MKPDSRVPWLPRAAMAASVLIAVKAAWRVQKKRCGVWPEVRSTWLDVKGLRMHVRRSGSETACASLPVVLVHGWGVSSSYFIPFAARLACRFHVYAPDLPGHGLSAKPAEAPGIEALAQALSDWMDAAGIACVMLIGHSMGCQVAVTLALRHPEKVERLVLIGLTPDPHVRGLGTLFGRLLIGALHERVSLMPHLIKDYFRMGMRLLPEFLSMMNDPIREKLPRLRMPVMLVRGENDPLSPQYWFSEAARLLPPCRTTVIPGGGHAVQHSAPQELAEAVLPFLDETLHAPVSQGMLFEKHP